MTFTLTIFPDGRALLSTPNHLSPEEAEVVRRQWELWTYTDKGMAIITDCEVQHAKSVEIELDVKE